jgi:hypothetical protein
MYGEKGRIDYSGRIQEKSKFWRIFSNMVAIFKDCKNLKLIELIAFDLNSFASKERAYGLQKVLKF